MRFRFLVSIFPFVLLMACSRTPYHSASDQYLKETGSIPPVQSAPNARIKTGPNYFPEIAISNMQLARQTPSLIPPGSNLERFKKQPAPSIAPVASSAVPVTSAPKTSSGVKLQSDNGVTALMVSATVSQVWSTIPKVLANTPYHILDQNQAQAVYYVLDTTQTDGQITQTTPIYRMSLAPISARSSIIRLFNRDASAAPAKVSQRILNTVAQNWG